MSKNDDEQYLTFPPSQTYAPRVPKGVSPTLGTDYELAYIVRDALVNGGSTTRANLALAELVKRMKVLVPKLELDPEPFITPDGSRSEAAKGAFPETYIDPETGDAVEHPQAGESWEATFQPRFGYSQSFADYNPGPTAIGWYDDPDGSGKERWWMGTVWSDNFRDKKERLNS